jgi:predicted ester cyclase
MTNNKDIVLEAYRVAEGATMDTDAFRALFTEDGVLDNKGQEQTYVGDDVKGLVAGMGQMFPDVHRELLQIHEMGDVIAVQLLIQGTHQGAFPTPLGDLAPTGAKINVPTADFWYLKDGKIERFDCYISFGIMLGQIGIYPDFAKALESVKS